MFQTNLLFQPAKVDVNHNIDISLSNTHFRQRTMLHPTMEFLVALRSLWSFRWLHVHFQVLRAFQLVELPSEVP